MGLTTFSSRYVSFAYSQVKVEHVAIEKDEAGKEVRPAV
jgi:hypothetical protein